MVGTERESGIGTEPTSLPWTRHPLEIRPSGPGVEDGRDLHTRCTDRKHDLSSSFFRADVTREVRMVPVEEVLPRCAEDAKRRSYFRRAVVDVRVVVQVHPGPGEGHPSSVPHRTRLVSDTTSAECQR